jgi:hypothetical protein
MRGGSSIRTPAKRTVVCYQIPRNRSRIDVLECSYDSVPRIQFIIRRDFTISYDFGNRHRPMKVVDTGGAETRDGLACLRPGDGIFRMGVCDSAYRGERFVGAWAGRRKGASRPRRSSRRDRELQGGRASLTHNVRRWA